MAPTPRVRPYKDFLTPALHRRFAMATTVLFGLCFLESLAIGQWNHCRLIFKTYNVRALTCAVFWSWFPFGRAGIRAGLLFIPAFMIFLLRVGQLHVGYRTSNSAYQTFLRYAPRKETMQTVGWYLFSAYLFSEIYIWSASKEADLNRIKMIRNTERPTLNERPIYLTCFFYFLAIVQTGVHLYFDYDRIDMPTIKTKPQGSGDGAAYLALSPEKKLWAKMPKLAASALYRSVVMAIASPFIYSFTVRNFAWSFTRSFAKAFWSLPKSNALPTIRPFHWGLLMRTVTAGFLLIMLWEVGNAAFSVYTAQEPLKNDRPITYESRDPNGSLLTGLTGKKLQTRVRHVQKRCITIY